MPVDGRPISQTLPLLMVCSECMPRQMIPPGCKLSLIPTDDPVSDIFSNLLYPQRCQNLSSRQFACLSDGSTLLTNRWDRTGTKLTLPVRLLHSTYGSAGRIAFFTSRPAPRFIKVINECASTFKLQRWDSYEPKSVVAGFYVRYVVVLLGRCRVQIDQLALGLSWQRYIPPEVSCTTTTEMVKSKVPSASDSSDRYSVLLKHESSSLFLRSSART
jgi:hypothetical protein